MTCDALDLEQLGKAEFTNEQMGKVNSFQLILLQFITGKANLDDSEKLALVKSELLL